MDAASRDHYVEALRKASAHIRALTAEQAARALERPIAIVGMGCRFPGGANDPERFWALLERGGDAVAEIPADRFDLDRWWSADPDAPGRIYVREAALIDDVRSFDPAFFRITPAEAEALDPQQRLLLEVSWEAFEDAAIDVRRLAGSRTGVFIGLSNYDYIQAHVHSGDPARITAYSGSGVMFSTAAGRLSYFYDLRGPCITLDTACSSSLVALDAAITALRQRDCDVALAGGVSLMLSPDSSVALCKVKALAADGRSRAFDDAATGYGRGEGCGLVVLKRLSDAVRDGDLIHGVLAGSAVNHDGRSNGLTAPNGLAQQAVLRSALADAGITPDRIDYVEAHGTGTPLGDPIEFGALDAVFGDRPRAQGLKLGSVKTNIGHTEAAAGIAGVIKAVLAIRHRTLPPSIHFDTPNRHIDWARSTLSVVAAATAWPETDHDPAVGVSSFGLSGTNAHVIVTAAPVSERAPPSRRLPYVLPLSAASPAALTAAAARWAETIAAADPEMLGELAATAAARTPLPHRAVAIGTNSAALAQALAAIDPPRPDSPAPGPRLAFLFSGQGAHYAGMGRALHAAEPIFRAAFDRCAAVADALLGQSLLGLLDDAPALSQTGFAQPATFALQWALAELWASWGVLPDAVAGHSIGEFAAATVAGVLSPEAAMRLVIARAAGMQALPAGGAMAAVFTDVDTVRAALASQGDRVAVAAINAARAVTVSGDAAALDTVLAALHQAGIEAIRLDVSHAFHSPLMAPMLPRFHAAAMDETPAAGTIAVYSTVTGARLAPDTPLDADYWVRQISAPVRFADAVAALQADRFDRFLEIGPGDVVAGFARQAGARVALASLRRGTDAATQMATTAAALWNDGMAVDWSARSGKPTRTVGAPHYPFQRKPYWLEVGPLRPPAWSDQQQQQQQAGVATQTEGHRMETRTPIVDHLVTTLALVAGFDRAEINPSQHLTDMGLDSLMLLKLGQAVERDYGVELKMSQLFNELGTLGNIARYLAGRATRLPESALPATAPDPVVASPVAADSAPTPPLATHGSESGLFQQQLQAMTDLAAQHLRGLAELSRLQLASATAQPAPAQPSVVAPRPSVAAPAPPRPNIPAPIPVAQIRGINLAGARLTEEQQQFVDELITRHLARAGSSKTITRDSRHVLADWKHTLSFWGQLKEAKFPIVSAASKGARVTDIDGNVYIDIAMGMGVHFFGHAPDFIHDALKQQLELGIELGTQTPFASKAALLLTGLTGTERVAFSNTGSEVVMVALRLARAATGRKTVVLFKNSYHGIFDGVLATEEDGERVPIGLGTPEGMIEDLVILPYDSPASLDYIRAHGDDLAAVLVEPVQSRNPDLQPQGFLKALRKLTTQSGTALIFDEMINGFRIAPGGAREWFGVDADIALYGKIVGGGMPIGVIAGKARFLDYIDGGDWAYGDRSGPQSAMIYFGGTFCRNPATMVTTHAALAHLHAEGPALQARTTARTTAFCDRLNHWFERERVPLRARYFSSQWRIVPVGVQDREPIELELLYLSMMVRGVYTWERRISFFSTAHGEADIAIVFAVITAAIEEIRARGFAWSIDAYPDPQFTPLSSPERRMYALAQRDGGDLPYHLPQAFVVDGPLDIDRLEEAFRTVILRHEALRTAFVTIDGEPLAKRIAEPRFAIARETIDASEVDSCLRRFVRPFDLAEAPLMRVGVATLAPDRHLLMADAHHIAVDGLSFDIVAGDLMAAYEGHALAPVAYDARAARRAVDAGGEGARGAANAAFWRDQLADPPTLDLPTDRARPRDRDFTGDVVVRALSADRVASLKTLAKTSGNSLYIVLLAAWSAFLHRLTDQDDIVVGGASSGRETVAAASAVGMFVNTILFRTRPRADMPFTQHLAAVTATALAAYDHGDFPFEAMAAMAPNPEPGRNALFDTMLSYENTTARAFRIDDLVFTSHDVPITAAMFDLALDVAELDGALTLRFAFATALFDRGTIEHWADAFLQMLDALPGDPDRPLGRIDLQTPGERSLIAQVNATAARYPEVTLADLFTASATRHAERTAVIFGDTRLSYADLDRRSAALSAAIADRAPVGASVCMLLPRSEACVVAALAILRAGCVFVPLDPRAPAALLDHILRDSACAVVITDATTAPLLPEAHRALALDHAATGDARPRPARAPDEVAYSIYTSGSTGLPKGCLVTHRNVVRLLANDRPVIAFGPHDVGVCAHSFAFDFSIWEIWCALAHGGSVVIADGETARDPRLLLDLVQAHRVTVLNQTPAAFYGFVDAVRATPVPDLASHLRAVIFGGDLLEFGYLRPWVALYPLDRIALINVYGITETTVHVSWHRIAAADLDQGRSIIGRPLPETTIEVVDANGLPSPIGVPGELWIGGGGVCLGYRNRADLTAERFVDTPGRRRYRSGDIGRRTADGAITYIGRNDHQVQVRGHRIELAGIQHWLVLHPDIEQAVVIAHADADRHTQLVAYIVAAADLAPDMLRAYLGDHLPGYAIPAQFVSLPALPLTANGKLDRAALPVPDAASAIPSPAIQPPTTTMETTIAAVWADVLRTPTIGTDQNYFALGGDSIKALQIVSRLHQAGVATTVAQVLNAKTVAALATIVARSRPQAEVAASSDTASLTPIQHWFVETHGASGHFNNAALLAADDIDTEALAKAVAALVARHEGLHQTLDLSVTSPRVRLARDMTVPIEQITVASVAELTAHAADAQTRFDVAHAPLLRFVHYRLPGTERLLILCHHLVIDGVSWRILIEDLLSAYTTARTGAPIALPCAGRWTEWSAALAEAAQDPALLGEVAYWHRIETADIAPLPCDFDDDRNAVGDARTVRLTLDEAATARLVAAASADETGMAAHLLAATALACRACFRLDRLRIRLEGHGRAEIAPALDQSRTVGWFTTLFPALVDIGTAEDRSSAASHVASMLGAIPRKGIGYGLLRYLAPASARAGLVFGPAPELGFNYLGHFDTALGGGFHLADEPTGGLLAPTLRRPELLDIEAAIIGGCLEMAIGYGERLHARATIERFAAAMRDALAPSAADEVASPALLAAADLTPAAIETVLALSPLQEGMYFHAATGDRHAYLQQFTYRIRGPLDHTAYAAAWQQLTARHQALRAAIAAAPGDSPRQLILKDRPIPIRHEDVRRLSKAKRTTAVTALAEAERTGFDLAHDPLVRIVLVRLGEAESDVILTLHHIISDGWSLGVMMAELRALYRAQVDGQVADLPPAPPLSQHIAWLAKQDEQAARRFWSARLHEAPSPSTIPGIRPGDGHGYAVAEQAFAFDASTTRSLTTLAASQDITLNTLVQAMWATLLAGFNGSDDVIFGAIASGRPADLADVERMVGLFLQPIPVRARIAPDDTIATLAQRLQRDANDAAPFHYFPLAAMQRLGGTRRAVFDHVLVFENYPFADGSNGVLHIGDVRAVEQMHFDFSLVVQPGDTLEIKVTYNRHALDAAEIDRIETQWRALAATLLEAPDRPLGSIDLGGAVELAPSAPSAGTVLDLFARQAADHPEAIAVDDGTDTVSYEALDARADALARVLVGIGVGHGDRVAAFLPSGADHIATMLAVWKCAAVFVPLDIDAPARRLAHLVAQIAPAALVTTEPLRNCIASSSDLPADRIIAWVANGTVPAAADADLPALHPTPTDAAYVMFTSGSTGTPKAILASHAGLRHFIDWEIAELGIGAGTRVANLALPTFDVSLRDIFLPLAAGGTACIAPRAVRRDGAALVAWLSSEKIAVAHVVPSIFRLALKAIEEAPTALPDLRHLLFGGEMLWGADVERARATLGGAVTLRNLYGPSETTLAKCCYRIDGPVAPARAIPVGAPLPGTQVLIVKDDRLAAPGAIGELYIAPPFAPLGYLGDAQKTAEHFITRAEWGDRVFYRTGDLGRSLANGAIEVCGRLDGQVKVNGVRIELGEIEQAAMASDEVDAAVAIAHKREDGELSLACYYTLTRPLDPAALRARLALELPAPVMPHFLIPLDALPLGVNGKVDRRALPKPEELVTGRIAHVEPDGAVETRVAAIWSEVLGLKRIGATTPFFEVGGDSLRAIRVLTRINAEFGAALSIGAFFTAPTVRAMAAALAPTSKARAQIPIVPLAEDYPVSHAQRRLWVLAQLGGNPAAYVLSAAYRLDGALAADALISAIEALPMRHDALRTVFLSTPDGVRQRPLADLSFEVATADLTEAADPEQTALALAEANAARSFDLATGPLLAATLLTLAPDRHVLLFAVHHIVSDAESVTVMVEEIVQLARGAALPPLRLQLKEQAAVEAAWLRTPAATATRDWWHAQLHAMPDRLDLPFDRLPPPMPSYDGDRVSVMIDTATIDALRAVARAADTTVFAGLVALVAALLQRHTACDALMLGMPVACRDDADFERQVGFYVNLLPLRLELDDRHDVAGLVRHAGATIAAAIDHRAYPFDRLVEELHLTTDDGRPPAFDVAVVFQDGGQRVFAFDGVTVTPFGRDPGIAKYPLSFEFVEHDDGITLNVEYATDLFDRARIERMARHFANLVKAAVTDPTAKVTTLDLFDAAERDVLMPPVETIALPEPATVPAQFAAWVARHPDAAAVIGLGTTLSYADLDDRANALARALAGRGIGQNHVVAVLLDRSEMLVVAFLGVLMAGAIYLPLDPSYPPERIAFMLEDSGARVVLTEGHVEDSPATQALEILDIRALGDDRNAEPDPPAADDLAYLIYTSGSTGRPNGVLLEHRGAVSLALAQRHGLQIEPEDRIVQFAPSSFDASVWEMVMALLNGACLVVVTIDQIRDPRAFARRLADTRVTVATVPPSYLATLDDAALAPLDLLITAGEAPDAARAARLARRMGVVNAYGPTETTVCASWHHVDARLDASRAIPIGRAIANAAVIVLDRFGNLAPLGVAGELHIGGAGLARGYHDRPDLTRAAFVDHPLVPGERLYRTGDRGIVDTDGTIRFAGRRDRQVKLRGHRIELAEVERAILRLPGVAAVAVALRPGPSNDELVAFVIPDGQADTAALSRALAQHLPAAMLPSRWVPLADLPMMPNGKVDYAALVDTPAGPTPSTTFDDPREALVAAAWVGVLGHSEFGRHDRFFAVGGDSIRAIQVIGRLLASGHGIEMRAFLTYPSVAGIAALLAEAPDAAAPSARVDLADVEALFGHG
ncbi:conserved hypothetical protein [Sphingomonas aurantiaca]|uniref:Amino acid adenylation domain-containing protein n=1 Tax=Sphingomonas aurantiaca TaxID=185949 RepID=A0A5E8AKR2_9SPHN|nr:non-ribosomal peptide synthetase/type I polyketide synthase [Sphingomonas aurantiaca]VVT32020.1 conserved hypothetical protein [Sphingomonas aurantiaca]